MKQPIALFSFVYAVYLNKYLILYNNNQLQDGSYPQKGNYQFHMQDQFYNQRHYHNPLHSLHIFQLRSYNKIQNMDQLQCILRVKRSIFFLEEISTLDHVASTNI